MSLTLLLATGAGACSGGAGVVADGGDLFVTCETETRALPYEPGMQVMSEPDPPVFTVRLLESFPGPPVKGQNRWTLQVDEVATGNTVDGLDIAVMPWMPDHRHGTTPVAVTPAGAGTYTLDPVYLYMSGLWQVKLVIVATMVQGGVTETAMIPICIP